MPSPTTSSSVLRARVALFFGLAIVAGAVVVALGSLGIPPSVASVTPIGKPTPIPPDDRTESPGGVTEADGIVHGDVTVFDDRVPAVHRLEPGLLDAVRRAASAASGDGVTFFVNSGWRSPAYQRVLLRDAIATYGSADEAARWVATPETSPHVQGDAVDIGEMDAAAWLSTHGEAFGLCQIYTNESWHFELRPDAVVDGCPPMYADPTQDPRMRR
jgi:hypothetical protein